MSMNLHQLTLQESKLHVYISNVYDLVHACVDWGQMNA